MNKNFQINSWRKTDISRVSERESWNLKTFVQKREHLDRYSVYLEDLFAVDMWIMEENCSEYWRPWNEFRTFDTFQREKFDQISQIQ